MCEALTKMLENERCEGIEQGIEQGMEQGIRVFIADNLEEGIPEERIVEKLVRHFLVTVPLAQEYLEKYHD